MLICGTNQNDLALLWYAGVEYSYSMFAFFELLNADRMVDANKRGKD